jgi:hypothetical protein
MSEFIDNLPVSDDDKQKLRALGASSPFGVLSIRKASRNYFDQHFGPHHAQAIEDHLRPLLTPDELRRLDEPSKQGGALGARLTPIPGVKD